MPPKSRRQHSRPGGRPAGRPGATPARRTPTAAPRAQQPPAQPARTPFVTPGAKPFRRAVETRTATLLVFLRGLPRAVPALLVLGLAATGILVPGIAGAAALAVVALLLGWLLFLSWPALPGPGRFARLLTLGIIVAGLVVRLT